MRRRALRWSADVLARRAGLDGRVINLLESGGPMELEDDELLRKLAAPLGVLPRQLCNSPLMPANGCPVLREGADGTWTLQQPEPEPRVPAPEKSKTVTVRPLPAGRARRMPVFISGFLLGALLLGALPRACAPAAAPPPAKAKARTAAAFPAASLPLPKTRTDFTPMVPSTASGPAQAESPPVLQELEAWTRMPVADLEHALSDAVRDGIQAERIVLVLVLVNAQGQVPAGLTRYLKRVIEIHDGALPPDYPAVRPSLRMGGGQDSPLVHNAVSATLADPALPQQQREQLAQDWSDGATLASGAVPQVASPLASHNQQPLAAPPASPGRNATPSLDALREALSQGPPATEAEAASILEQAARATQEGGLDELRPLLAGWLKSLPPEWNFAGLFIEGIGLWRWLGWTLFPSDAPRWEWAFGTTEQSWSVLVIGQLLTDLSAEPAEN